MNGRPESGPAANRLRLVTAPDTAIGAFSDSGPWVVDPDAMRWRHTTAALRAGLAASLPRMVRPRLLPPGAQRGHDGAPPGGRHRSVVLRREALGRRGVGGRDLAAPAGRGREARADLHQARPDRGLGRWHLPARARRRVQVVPRRGAGRTLGRRGAGPDRGPPPPHRRGVRLGRTGPAGGCLHRAGARGAASRRDPRRGESAATGRGPARRRGPGGHGLARPAPRRADPGGRPGQSARTRRAVRGDDHRGARLQARGREHARRRHDVRCARTARTSWCRARTPRSSRAACS